LLGKRFPVLKRRRVSGVERLTLRGTSGGTINVPREWTDLAEPSACQALGVAGQILDFKSLLDLIELIQDIEQSGGEDTCE
jgi:DNA primase